MKRRVLTAILLAACVLATAAEKESPKGLLSKLPAKSGAFLKGPITVFAEKELGAAVSYNAPGCFLDLYLYDQGVKKVPDGAASPVILNSWEGAKNDIFVNMKSTGSYRDLVMDAEQTLRIEAGPAALDILYVRYKGEVKIGQDAYAPCFTEVFITGFKNYICKARVTRASDTNGADARDLFARLLSLL